jgi:hypothetical protein
MTAAILLATSVEKVISKYEWVCILQAAITTWSGIERRIESTWTVRERCPILSDNFGLRLPFTPERKVTIMDARAVTVASTHLKELSLMRSSIPSLVRSRIGLMLTTRMHKLNEADLLVHKDSNKLSSVACAKTT